MNSPLDQISPEDQQAARQIVIDYMLQAGDEQKRIVYSIANKISESLGLSAEDSLIAAGVAIRDAAATTAIEGSSLDEALKMLEEGFEWFVDSCKRKSR